MSIREIRLSDGRTRYRFMVDVARTTDGRRRQLTRTFDSRTEAEEALVAYRAARKPWDSSTDVRVTDLFLAGRCHPMCVFAVGVEEKGCVCTCKAKYHGRLSDMTASWAVLESAEPRRVARPAKPRKPKTLPLVKDRVVELFGEAMSDDRWNRRPATYIRDRLDAEGSVSVTREQVTQWIAYLRRVGTLPPAVAHGWRGFSDGSLRVP